MFLQETHSTFNDENIWKNDFTQWIFSHGTSQSCGVLIANVGNINFSANKQVGDKNGNFSRENRIVVAGDLNIFFDSKLETKGGKPLLKKKSVAKLLELKEVYDLGDI